MKRDILLAIYAAELKRTLGRDASVKMVRGRVEVVTRSDIPGNRYTLKQIAAAVERLKQRPNFDPTIPDFLTTT